MINKAILRQDDLLAQYRADLIRRGENSQPLDVLVQLDETLRSHQTELQSLQQALNTTSAQIGKAMRELADDRGDVTALKERSAVFKDDINRHEKLVAFMERDRADVLMRLPNALDPSVPNGADEKQNVEIKRWGDPKEGGHHYDFDGVDAQAGVRLAGSRFTVLRGYPARLHRALGQFLLDNAESNGFEQISVPLLVNGEIMEGTGQLPKFVNDAYVIENQFLIPTAEVSLTNLYREQIIDFPDDAPQIIRMTALTPCFRKEAGSAGKDTRGILRQHQFEKVELVSLCRPADADQAHEDMVRVAEMALEKLGLPYRRVLLCAGDTGFSARKTYDLEVWMAGDRCYREISSVSQCGDFQARRMNARFRDGKKVDFVHTLNGSALAVGRCLAAVLETYGETVPDVLKSYV